jgi:hypothetical protein
MATLMNAKEHVRTATDALIAVGPAAVGGVSERRGA